MQLLLKILPWVPGQFRVIPCQYNLVEYAIQPVRLRYTYLYTAKSNTIILKRFTHTKDIKINHRPF